MLFGHRSSSWRRSPPTLIAVPGAANGASRRQPRVTGLFIWRQIDDQRQRSLVTGADLVLRTIEVEP
jgi:hypothetical protein